MCDTPQLGSLHWTLDFSGCSGLGVSTTGIKAWIAQNRTGVRSQEVKSKQDMVNKEIVLLVIQMGETFVQNLHVLTSAGDPGDADVKERGGILAFSFL